MRVNYDKKNEGIYIDIVDSKKSIVANNDEVWEATRRAVQDMAVKMNEQGEHIVNVVNFREDGYNKLKTQFNALPNTRMALKGRAYSHPRVNRTYGDNNAREQREVWANPKYFGGVAK